jgi:hypothetical protein
VLGTTIRLWLRRSAQGGRRTLALVTVLVVAAGLLAAFLVSGKSAPSGPAGQGTQTGSGGSAVNAATETRNTAARWIAGQVNRAADVACDPAMCAVLQVDGFPAANLVTVRPASSDPLGADLVVATPVLRSQFGARLASVYAPQAIATFGTGAGRIDIRVMLPSGASGSAARLAQKQQAAKRSGAQLLANQQIQVSGQARTALTDGQVDTRLMAILAVLSHRSTIDILDFGDANPGASAAVPLRSADLAAADPTRGSTSHAYRNALLTFLRAQTQAEYRVTSVTVLTTRAGVRVIRIEFAAPSP